MSVLFSNNAATTLAAGVGDSATSISVADGSVFPTLSGSDYFYLTLEVESNPDEKEIVKCTARSGNTLTISRAQDGTSARSFSTADKAQLRLTAAGLNDVATQADTDTTYTVGDGGLTQNNFTDTLKSKLDGIESSADVTDTANVVAALTAGTNVAIAADGTVSSTDTNTTYSVGDGGLTQKNFTSTLKTKLDGIEASANNYSHPSAHSISFITGLQTALDGKVDDSQVLTNVPENAVFTDTTYSVGDGGLTQNNFTNSRKTKLEGIEASADVTDTANVVAALTAGTNVAIAADGTISSTDTNTTYSVGDGGLTQKNFTTTLKTKLDGIEASADVTDTTNVVAALTAGTNVSIGSDGTISSTDTNTTYSVGDGGLTQNNFTDALKTKLDGIEASADVTDTTNVSAAGALMKSGGTLTGNLNLGDNNVITLGTGSDFKIYHDGSNSVIKDEQGSQLYLQSTGFNLSNSSGLKHIYANDSYGVSLYYQDSQKLTTSSAGIDVTGNVTLSGTVDGRDIATDGTKLDGVAANANNYSLPSNVGTQSVVTTAPTSASGYANGHVWYVVG